MADQPKQVPTDEFRSIDDVTKSDWRQTLFVTIDHAQGCVRPRTILDHHSAPAECALSDSVPEDIRAQWDTARNLWLYAWHVWRFYPVAERQAYSTLELVLRRKMGLEGTKNYGLSRLMNEAIANGLLKDSAIEHHRHLMEARREQFELDEQRAIELGWPMPDPLPVPGPQDYCRILAETFPKFRNMYSHGSTSLHWTVGFTFTVCRDLIDQLFAPAPPTSGVQA